MREWFNEVSMCCPDRPLQFFQLASQCAVCAVQECREHTLNMNWRHWQQTTVFYCTESLPLTKAEKVRERDVGQADSAAHWHTFSRWKNGDLLLFSLSLSPPPPPPPFNQTYYSQLKCEWTVWYSAQEQLNFSWVLFVCRVCWRTTVERNFSFSSSSSPHPTCGLSFFLL